MDSMTVHKRYRICRRHFDNDCLNGGCRRLLNTAVPTLYLGASGQLKIKMDEDEIEIDTTENIVYVPISSNDDFHDEDEQFQVMLDESDEVGEVKNARGKHETPIDDSYDLVLNGFFLF